MKQNIVRTLAVGLLCMAIFGNAVMTVVFAAPTSATDLDATTCSGTGWSWNSSTNTCLVLGDVYISDVTIPAGTTLYINNLGYFYTNATINNFGTINNSGTINNLYGTIFNACGGTFTNTGIFIGNSVQYATGCSCVQPPEGLISWWPGDGNANDIKDVNNGTLQNGTTFDLGKVGQAFSFDGVDDYVQLPNSNIFDGNKEFTIDAWVRPTPGVTVDPTGYATILAKFMDDTYEYEMPFVGYYRGNNNWTWEITTNEGENIQHQTGIPVAFNTWSHVAFVIDIPNKVGRFYLNGALQDEFPMPQITGDAMASSPTGWVGIGLDTPVHHPWSGLIDELEVFNRALTADEIKNIFLADSEGKCKDTTPPTIIITSPNGGENWARGSTQTIRWNYSGTSGPKVTIQLLKNGLVVRTVASSTPNDGSQAWTIPSTQSLGMDYKIRITSTSNPAYTDTSNNNFTIGGINVNSPNGGNIWVGGTTHKIKWSYAGTPGPKVTIQLLKNGLVVRTVASSTPNDGSQAWTISSAQTLGKDYKIRVTSTSNPAYTDTSNNNFTIGGINVNSPIN